jgi:hypothetical protein
MTLHAPPREIDVEDAIRRSVTLRRNGTQIPHQELDCAKRLVVALLPSTALIPALDYESIQIFIGEGNWISFECPFRAALGVSAAELSRVLNPRGARQIRRAAASSGREAWFRTRTRPSLHYRVACANNRFTLKGHVDAAEPLHHPLVHLVQDYLPARGVGRHPKASQLLARFLDS